MFAVDTKSNEIYLYDDIGPAWLGMIDAGLVMEALSQIGQDQRVTVRINSPGGSVDEGVAIFNLLRRHPGGVDTVNDSLAASMGSYLFMAGESRIVADNSRVMIHNPWTIAIGNAEELRSVADTLDTYSASTVGTYASATGQDPEQIREWLAAETWFTADEAVAQGFAHSVEGEAVDPVQVVEGRFQNTPEAILKPAEGGTRTPYPVQRERARILART